MKSIREIWFIPAVLFACMLIMQSCGSDSEPVPGGTGRSLLRLHVGLSSEGTRASEADKLPAGDGEKMQSLRVIIIGAGGFSEHNVKWNLSADPDIVHTTKAFDVRSDEKKTIVIVANEEGKTIVLPDGTKADAEEYFSGIDAAAGEKVDVDELRGITFQTADNSTDGKTLDTPLAITAIHEYYIGTEPQYSASFYIHRAAVKYSYRFVNKSETHDAVINSVLINNVASREYLFPDADFTDATQLFWDAYRTPDASGAELEVPVNVTVKAGETYNMPPVYLPEGHTSTADAPYMTGFRIDGSFLGWQNLQWHIPENTADLTLMTDLPRNTHVIVNVAFNYLDFDISYTICPWVESEIKIPDFN